MTRDQHQAISDLVREALGTQHTSVYHEVTISEFVSASCKYLAVVHGESILPAQRNPLTTAA